MPGHAHAAIAAMMARYHATNDTTYLLSDLHDRSQYKFVRFLILCLMTTHSLVYIYSETPGHVTGLLLLPNIYASMLAVAHARVRYK